MLDNIWVVILPIDELIFFRGIETTNQTYYSLDQVLITNNHYKPLLITIKTMVIAPATRSGRVSDLPSHF